MAPRSQSRLRTQANPEPDFYCENHGNIYLLRPVSPAAFSWIDQNLPEDHLNFGNAVVVEWRFISVIVRGAIAHGLTVHHGDRSLGGN